jgi:hypothetical protein
VLLGVRTRAEVPGGLDDDVDAEVRPRQVAGSVLAQHADLAAVEGDDVAVAGHGCRELPVDGVVGEEMGEGRGIGDVVDGDDLQIGAPLVGRAHEAATDAAEAVDGDASGHGCSPVFEGRTPTVGRRRPAGIRVLCAFPVRSYPRRRLPASVLSSP